MTREEILAMPAGRELDEIIEFEVIGTRRPSKGFVINPRHYSTDISAAMEAEGKVIEQSHQKMCEYVRNLMFLMGFEENDRHLSTFAKMLRSTPEQRCKAALLTTMEETP